MRVVDQKSNDQKKRAVRTRPFGREVAILAYKQLICKEIMAIQVWLACNLGTEASRLCV